jgi:hypothetical protein
MKIHLLNYITGSDKIRVLHYYMFHGQCVDVIEKMTWPQLRSFKQTLRLARNIWYVPGFFQPSTKKLFSQHQLVVVDDLKHCLEQFPSIGFSPVEFTKVIQYPYPVGDFSFYQSELFEQNMDEGPGSLFELLEDVPEAHALALNYHAVRIPYLSEIATAYDDIIQLPELVCFPYPTRTIPFSPRLFEDYPIIHYGYLLFSEISFQLVAPFVDWNYYKHMEIPV